MTPTRKRHSGECATLLAKAQLRVCKGGGIGWREEKKEGLEDQGKPVVSLSYMPNLTPDTNQP